MIKTVSAIAKTKTGDDTFRILLHGFSWLTILLFAAMVVFLGILSFDAMKTFGFHFFISSDWNPARKSFGALPFILGTAISSLIAVLIATPISIGMAVFLEEMAPRRLSYIMGFLVESLAAIPSVVYGLWGIFVLAPLMRSHVQPFLARFGQYGLSIFDGPILGIGLLSSGIILAIMIIPTITAFSKEVLKTVPDSVKEAALGLGATRWEMIKLALLKTARAGLVGSVVLGLGRAIGETMAVTMVIGNRNTVPSSLFDPAQTMASVIANEYYEADGLHLSSLAMVGLTLFFVAFVVNLLSRVLVRYLERGQRA